MVLFDAEFIEGFVKRIISKKPMPIIWEIAFLPRVLKIQQFWPKRKGPVLADSHNWTLAALKNKKYLSDLT